MDVCIIKLNKLFYIFNRLIAVNGMHFVIYEHDFPTDFYVILIVGTTVAAPAPVVFVDSNDVDSVGSVAAANVVHAAAAAAAADFDSHWTSSFRIFTIFFLHRSISVLYIYLWAVFVVVRFWQQLSISCSLTILSTLCCSNFHWINHHNWILSIKKQKRVQKNQ